jgi:hypothetical protein
MILDHVRAITTSQHSVYQMADSGSRIDIVKARNSLLHEDSKDAEGREGEGC